MSQSGETSRTLKDQNFQKSIYFPEDSPVKMFPLSEEKKESLDIEADYGKSFTGSFASYDQNTSSWRTSQACFLEGWIRFSEIWPRAGTMRGGTVFRLPPLVRHIKEIGYGYWPTPRASQDFKPIRKHCPKEAAGAHGETLCGYVGERWPKLIGKYMNPMLMEALMGLPHGWTDAGLQETAKSFRLSNGLGKE